VSALSPENCLCVDEGSRGCQVVATCRGRTSNSREATFRLWLVLHCTETRVTSIPSIFRGRLERQCEIAERCVVALGPAMRTHFAYSHGF